MNTAERNTDLEAARAAAAEAKQRTAALEAQLKADARASAERAVEEAIRRGVIPPKHAKLRAAWLAACQKDRAMIELLAMMPDSPALRARRNASIFHGLSVAPEPEPTPSDSAVPVYQFAQ